MTPIPIDPEQPYGIQTAKLGWKHLAAGLFCVGLGVAVIPIGRAEGEAFLIGLGVFLALVGLFCLYAVWRTNFRPRKDVMTLSAQGLHLHHGATGIIPWPDVLGARQVVMGGRAQIRYLHISVSPGVIDRLDHSRAYWKMRKLDRALGVDCLLFAETQLSVTIAQAIELLEIYHTAHAGPWASSD